MQKKDWKIWLFLGFGAVCIIGGILQSIGIIGPDRSRQLSPAESVAGKTASATSGKKKDRQIIVCTEAIYAVTFSRDRIQHLAKTGSLNIDNWLKDYWPTGCSEESVSSDFVPEVVQFVGDGDTVEKRKRKSYAFQVKLNRGKQPTGWVTVDQLELTQWPTGGHWEEGQKFMVGLLVAAMTISQARDWLQENGAGNYPMLNAHAKGKQLTREQVMHGGSMLWMISISVQACTNKIKLSRYSFEQVILILNRTCSKPRKPSVQSIPVVDGFQFSESNNWKVLNVVYSLNTYLDLRYQRMKNDSGRLLSGT